MKTNQSSVSKYIALESFMDRLLSSEVKDQIAKVILFGSVAEGTAGRHSDIDLIVFGLGDTDRISEVCAEFSLNVGIESGESVQALVYSAGDFLPPQSHFVYRTVRDGKEIYRMDKNNLGDEELRGYIAVADEYLKAAKNSLADGV